MRERICSSVGAGFPKTIALCPAGRARIAGAASHCIRPVASIAAIAMWFVRFIVSLDRSREARRSIATAAHMILRRNGLLHLQFTFGEFRDTVPSREGGGWL